MGESRGDVTTSAAVQSYPEPPWHTHGFAVMRAYRVRASAVRLPDGVEPITLAGQTAGMLAYVEYRAPSPLIYRELVWMPALVRVRVSGRTVHGYWVARMYVDDRVSLTAGRQVWALPKTFARIERTGDGVALDAEDGTRTKLRFGARGPGLRARTRMATVQSATHGVVRFRASTRANVRAGRLRVVSLENAHVDWDSFAHARPLPIPAMVLDPFETTMHAPITFEW